MATPANPSGDGARATLAQVAARAGVSPSTASLAFSGAGPVADETRERVLAAARELDYGGPDPRARSLRTGRSGIIAVVMEDRIRVAFRDPMVVTLLDGIVGIVTVFVFGFKVELNLDLDGLLKATT